MIERNIGNAERVVRLLLSAAVCFWLFNQPSFSAIEVLLSVLALFLFLNGVFSRCYLWFVLDVNTIRDEHGRCAAQQQP